MSDIAFVKVGEQQYCTVSETWIPIANTNPQISMRLQRVVSAIPINAINQSLNAVLVLQHRLAAIEEAAQAVVDVVGARCKSAVPEWAPEIRKAIAILEKALKGATDGK